MPRPRFTKINPQKKQKLLDAATLEFGTRSYESASINRILAAAGFSKGSFYYYFDDKADLAATTFIEAAGPEALTGAMPPPATARAFWSELRRLSHDRLKALESKRSRYDCVLRLANALATEPDLAARLVPLFAPSRKVMGLFLARGVELGALRSDIPIGPLMALIEAAKTSLYQSMYPGDQVPTDAQMESFSDLMLDLARRIAAPPKKG